MTAPVPVLHVTEVCDTNVKLSSQRVVEPCLSLAPATLAGKFVPVSVMTWPFLEPSAGDSAV